MGNQLTYGAVYYRKSNPPRGDWERDYRQAAADGMNTFRHWLLWGGVEQRPGHFEFEDYDRHLELAAKYGIKTIIAEMIHCAPQWLFRRHPEFFHVGADGARRLSRGYSQSCFVSGFSGGVCLDNPQARAYAANYLTQVARRYKGHPGLLGYDIWNECNASNAVCYCEHTQNAFRAWLEKKYGSLDALNRAWHQYSCETWEDVCAPTRTDATPDCYDWIEFRKESVYGHMQWRADLIRSIDPDCKITAHGIAGSLDAMASNNADDWLAASKVESYGMTWVIARKGSEPWKHWKAIDLLRAGSRDKPFWHSEMQGGPLWLQPQVIGREKEDGRVATAEDVRLWNMTSLAGGARGILYLRWRSLLDGQLFGAFGLYGNDGLPNERSRMASSIAKWGNAEKQTPLFAAKPVKGEIGIVVIPETQTQNHLMEQAGEGRFYTQCMWGAYQGFFDNGIQADWVHIDDIGKYDALYLPYPIHMREDQAAGLAGWVENGGSLIIEGAPGYFGRFGHVEPRQPAMGFARLCGVREHEVEFMPDIGDRISIDYKGGKLAGGLFLQSYIAEGANVLARYADGRVAMTENRYGGGKVMLIGTYPSQGYYRAPDETGRGFFADTLDWAGKQKRVTLSDDRVRARLWRDEAGGRNFVWAVNPLCEAVTVRAKLAVDGGSGSGDGHGSGNGSGRGNGSGSGGNERSHGREADALWGDSPVFTDGEWELHIGAKDALVFEIK